jgi:hypothetical protein
MRLDIDVLRETMLYLEKSLAVEIIDDFVKSVGEVDPLELPKALGQKFENKPKTVLYAVRMLSDAGLINKCVTVGADGEWAFDMINDITFAGHEFLECIRNSTTWIKTKEIARKTGCQAVSFLGRVASGVVSGLINEQISGM